MKAAVYYGAGDIRIEGRPKPTRGAGEALIRVTRSGMCGTDATEWKSGPIMFPVNRHHPISGHEGPLIIGHEFIGVIEAVDDDSPFAVGDRVASGAGISCGACIRCAEGRTNLCTEYRTLGLNVHGGMAEFVAAPVSTLVRIPDTLSDDAAGLAQPLAVGIHAAKRSRVKNGDRVLLMGAGAIGTFVLAGLRHLAPEAEITVSDFSGSRLERAERLGAAQVLPVNEPDYEGRLQELKHAFDVVIEASGVNGQLLRALGVTRDGGTILQVGMPAEEQPVNMHGLVLREIDIRTTLAHICGEDLPDAIDILATTNLVDEMFDSVHPLNELPAQLDRLVAGEISGKVLFDPAL